MLFSNSFILKYHKSIHPYTETAANSFFLSTSAPVQLAYKELINSHRKQSIWVNVVGRKRDKTLYLNSETYAFKKNIQIQGPSLYNNFHS